MNALPPPPGRKRRHPNAVEANRPHQWGVQARNTKHSPGWLNEGSSSGRTCGVCGVTEKGNFILADHAGFGSDGDNFGDKGNRAKTYTYTDAKGNTFTSQKELGCPVFVLDHLGTTMENRAMLREVDDRVDRTDDRVDDHEARLQRLETENEELRRRLSERVDVTALVEWLGEMVALNAAQKLQTVQVQIEGRPVAALPPPIADLIIGLGEVREPEPIPVKKIDPDES